jgi:hypothetical protein
VGRNGGRFKKTTIVALARKQQFGGTAVLYKIGYATLSCRDCA